MLSKFITWGEIRRMHKASAESGSIIAGDPLADLEFAKGTESIPDEEYYFADMLSKEEIEEYENRPKPAPEKYYFTYEDIRDREKPVLALLEINEEADTWRYRKNGDWVLIEAQDDIPEIDDRDMERVWNPKGAIAQWDVLEASGDPKSRAALDLFRRDAPLEEEAE